MITKQYNTLFYYVITQRKYRTVQFRL